MSQLVKMKAGRYKIPVVIEKRGKRLFFQFPFNRELMSEIKAMQGARWHGYDDENPQKVWSILDCARNRFQLEFLMGKNPYERYDQDLGNFNPARDVVREHQVEFIRHGLTRKQCIIAGEMGTGKTLAAIEIIEKSGYTNWVWVGPRSALAAVRLDFSKWKANILPRFITYDRLRIEVAEGTFYLPDGIVFDESAKVKSPTAQRSQAAIAICEEMRNSNPDCYIILMSGAPAPKSPADWWNQCCTKETWVLTENGPKQIFDLIGTSINLRVQDSFYKSEKGFFCTGQRETVILETKEGYKLEATPDHKVMSATGEWVELGKFNIGDKLLYANYSDSNWLGCSNFGEGYVLGLLFGDGCICVKQNSKIYGQLQFFDNDKHLIDVVKQYLPDISISGDGPWRVSSKHLNHLIREFGFTPKKEISTLFESTISSDCMRGFIRGFFDADGTVSNSTLRVQLGQTDKDRLYTIQRMLSYFGIQSRIQERNGSKGNINGRTINSKELNYVLHITNNSAKKFYERIGFHHKDKQDRLKTRIDNRHSWPHNSWATVKSITKGSVKNVYDITVPVIHSFSANGLLAHNCELACPGFLREGDINKFKNRLALIKQKESITGGVYPELVTWLDDPRKCKICGKFDRDHVAGVDSLATNGPTTDHAFERSVDEVTNLYKRMQGLVLVKFKKDCLDLPERQFRVIQVEPSESTKRAARLILSSASRSIQALILLRELSDGFQYKEEEKGVDACPRCYGNKEVTEWYDPENPDETVSPEAISTGRCQQRVEKCPRCNGTGEVPGKVRVAKEIPCPKEKLLVDLLDEHEPIGRFVVYAGFEASVDRCVRTALRYNWDVLRVDGRGWAYFNQAGDQLKLTSVEMLCKFQESKEDDKICFIGQPGAAGMGLTLTASPSVFFYSNTFNGEDRIQAMDRIHRLGMDYNRGATVIDVVHLPIDQYILDNLQKKIDLQALSMGSLRDAAKAAEEMQLTNVERVDYERNGS